MITQEEIRKSLQNMIDNIDEFEGGDGGEWYGEQLVLGDSESSWYEEDATRSQDQFLMNQAFKYPELHPLMRDAVKAITDKNSEGDPIWNEDEEHAGTNAAVLLAVANKEDVPLYAYFLATNDLNHPVYQEDEDWPQVFEKWGQTEETLLLLLVITLIPGQWFDTEEYWEEFAEFLKEGNNIDLFFKRIHCFLRYVEEADLPARDVEDFFDERLTELLPDEISEDEELVNHIKEQFYEYPNVPEPPTLAMLMKGYEKE